MHPGTQGYGVAPSTQSWDGPMADDLYPIDVSMPSLEEFRLAVTEAGYTGRDDGAEGTDFVIWAPMWMVLDVPGGTWTTTPYGIARCVDFGTTGAECSGGEFIPGWPDFVSPEWMPSS